MFNLLKLPVTLDYQELNSAAEYAFDMSFNGWTADDFSELASLLKDKIGIDKYLELEESSFRHHQLSLAVLPKKGRKMQDNSLKRHHSLLLAYAYWRLATGSLVVQNRLQELQTVRSSSAQKVVDISLNFLNDVNYLLHYVPIWCAKMPVPSPFLDEDGNEIHHLDDLFE